jgi:hypothetical protein
VSVYDEHPSNARRISSFFIGFEDSPCCVFYTEISRRQLSARTA